MGREVSERFIPSAVLPLQDPALALAELRRTKPRVVNTVWIHPEATPDPWFQRYAQWNCAGQSIEAAKVMASLIGADRLVMGSDYPVGEKDPVGFVRANARSEAEFRMMCGGNAARLLGLGVEQAGQVDRVGR